MVEKESFGLVDNLVCQGYVASGAEEGLDFLLVALTHKFTLC